MKKALLALLCLSGVSSAEPLRIYYAKAVTGKYTDTHPGRHPSCGASERMKRDTHMLVVDENWDVSINGLKWDYEGYNGDHAGLPLSFHHKGNQITYLTMDLHVDDRKIVGTYTLHGTLERTKDGFIRCSDTVELVGYRR